MAFIVSLRVALYKKPKRKLFEQLLPALISGEDRASVCHVPGSGFQQPEPLTANPELRCLGLGAS